MVELWRIDPADGHEYEWWTLLEHYEPWYGYDAIEAYWYKRCKPIFGQVSEERRADPADGVEYTFSDIVAFYKKSYSKKEIQNYWDNTCQPIPERRIDPVDGVAYTFEEISAFYRGKGDHDAKSIQEYWDRECAFVTISPLLLPASAVGVDAKIPPLSLTSARKGGKKR